MGAKAREGISNRSPDDAAPWPSLQDDPVRDPEIDLLLDGRDTLIDVVSRLEGYLGAVPTELAARHALLAELRPKLEDTQRRIAVMRGDFLPGNPESRRAGRDRGVERALRIFGLRDHYERTHGRGWRAKLAADEGCTLTNLKRLLVKGKKLALQGRPQATRRAVETKGSPCPTGQGRGIRPDPLTPLIGVGRLPR